MPERLAVAAVRWLALALLVIAIALIIIRWKCRDRPSVPYEGSIAFWHGVWRRWRERKEDVRERDRSLQALRGQTALVVDPDEKSCRVMSWKLENLGCRVVQARSGSQGAAMAANHDTDLVIADALLPDVSASDFYEMLDGLNAPVIFIGVLRDQRDELRSLGPNVACVAKPYDPEEVAALAGYLLRRTRQEA